MRDPSSIFTKKQSQMPTAAEALTGRSQPMQITGQHFVNGNPMKPPFPEQMQHIVLGLGCFWGAERVFWQLNGVFSTAVGYSAGLTPNPTYEEVCTGRTGHNEVVLVVFDPSIISLKTLLQVFWQSHDPTQGMRQGNDSGTQYRSGIYFTNADQQALAEELKQSYAAKLKAAGYPEITTEILSLTEFYYAEEYHQQYLAKNPSGYCGLGGTGVACSA